MAITPGAARKLRGIGFNVVKITRRPRIFIRCHTVIQEMGSAEVASVVSVVLLGGELLAENILLLARSVEFFAVVRNQKY